MKGIALVWTAAALLLTSACASQTQDPPNVSVTSDPAAVRNCAYKGIIDYDFDALYSDVQTIRAPDVRLRASKLGGNVLLKLPGRPLNKAIVYACEDLSPLEHPATP